MAVAHKVSDFLKDRHPWQEIWGKESFTGVINPHQVSRAYGRRFSEKLVAVLRNSDTTTEEKRLSMALLWQESSNQEKKATMIAEGVVECCVQQLGSPEAELRIAASRLLGPMLAIWDGRARFKGIPGSLAAVSQAATDSEEQVRGFVAAAFTRITSADDGQRIALSGMADLGASAGAGELAPLDEEATTTAFVRVMVAALPDNHALLEGMAGLTARQPEGSGACLAAGLMPKLLPLLQPTNDQPAVCLALDCLRQMVARQDGKKAGVKAEVAVPVTSLLRHSSERIRALAAGVLATLLVLPAAKRQFYEQCGDEGVGALCTSLRDEAHPAVATNAGVAVRALFQWPAARASVVASILQFSAASITENVDKLSSVLTPQLAGPQALLMMGGGEGDPARSEQQQLLVERLLSEATARIGRQGNASIRDRLCAVLDAGPRTVRAILRGQAAVSAGGGAVSEEATELLETLVDRGMETLAILVSHSDAVTGDVKRYLSRHPEEVEPLRAVLAEGPSSNMRLFES